MSTPVRRAIYGKMSGDTTLTNLLGSAASGFSKAIYHGQAPAGAGFPFIVMNKQSGVPTAAFSDPAAFDTDMWLIKAIDRNTSADIAEAIADRLTVLLNDATLSISNGALMYLRRESDVEYSEVASGVTYAHAGALFRLIWQ